MGCLLSQKPHAACLLGASLPLLHLFRNPWPGTNPSVWPEEVQQVETFRVSPLSSDLATSAVLLRSVWQGQCFVPKPLRPHQKHEVSYITFPTRLCDLTQELVQQLRTPWSLGKYGCSLDPAFCPQTENFNYGSVLDPAFLTEESILFTVSEFWVQKEILNHSTSSPNFTLFCQSVYQELRKKQSKPLH